MEIYYSNRKLEKILSTERLLKEKFGDLTRKIMARMTEFRAAKNLSEITYLPPPRRHKLVGYPNRFAVSVSGNFRIIFESLSEELINPIDIRSIKIIEIEDYH